MGEVLTSRGEQFRREIYPFLEEVGIVYPDPNDAAFYGVLTIACYDPCLDEDNWEFYRSHLHKVPVQYANNALSWCCGAGLMAVECTCGASIRGLCEYSFVNLYQSDFYRQGSCALKEQDRAFVWAKGAMAELSNQINDLE